MDAWLFNERTGGLAATATDGVEECGSAKKFSIAEDPDTVVCDESFVHKTILVGDSGVGKTSFLVQFDTGKFQHGCFAATVGIGFTTKTVLTPEGSVKLQIWDTAGQERFRSITHAYYRDAHALLLLYDVTSKSSFDNIRAWLAEIKEYAHDDAVIVLIANKADMQSSRVIRREDGERLAAEFSVTFMETSAKNGHNVTHAFQMIATNLRQRQYFPRSKLINITPADDDVPPSNRSSCCGR
ncbi:Ras-related protein Rab-26 [Hypsibius exemplaris]|uniref:Ras-related protein Rab-26 n=1 Tax=Hypsibius exemplaris TaxID=2072580 RepID=A0A9X6RLC1_HYPEX|nr:Ras-related protein Rab-26 [Hypsibius exemplaris]